LGWTGRDVVTLGKALELPVARPLFAGRYAHAEK